MSDSNWDEEFHDSVESIRRTEVVMMPADQTSAFEQGLNVGKTMNEDKDKKDQIKAIVGIQKELHELNKTLKQIAGRVK